ncbi:hypothetical protein TRICI_002485 [Trichomonascus ciferrii]|uniref:Ribosomal protein/NADH dehydrogenase domain-containing protein n=1 Tax=Trichomonascus ciferrii TaxID=44093 RepID=A0A642VC00_9ASCO|nr:hypothetical protein TRICI_002485 [Trichomonascus ciferrii]
MSAAKYVFPKALKELRIHVSQTDPASKALREALGVRPTVYARFGMSSLSPEIKSNANCFVERGQEAKVHVDQIPENQMEQTLKSLIERSN